MFKNHTDQLQIVINDRKNPKLVEVAVQSLAAVTKWNPDCGPTDKKVIERVMALALSGTPRQAKFASRFICVCGDGKAPHRLVDSLWEQLQSGDQEVVLPTLASLAELAIAASVAFRNHGDDIVQYIQGSVMLRPSKDETEEDAWAEEELLPVPDRAKLYALKVLTHNALPWCKLPDALDHVRPVLELLNDIMKNQGVVTEETNEG
jgi:sister-chromatid-cohesion protein PDS5